MAKFQQLYDLEGHYEFDCPGCKCSHYVNTKPERGAAWEFNGDLNKPTVSPSILVGSLGHVRRCHSFIKDGNIQFLSDCEHELAGQTVELPEYE